MVTNHFYTHAAIHTLTSTPAIRTQAHILHIYLTLQTGGECECWLVWLKTSAGGGGGGGGQGGGGALRFCSNDGETTLLKNNLKKKKEFSSCARYLSFLVDKNGQFPLHESNVANISLILIYTLVLIFYFKWYTLFISGCGGNFRLNRLSQVETINERPVSEKAKREGNGVRM